MKVRELIAKLKTVNPECEVSAPKGCNLHLHDPAANNRPYGILFIATIGHSGFEVGYDPSDREIKWTA